MADQKYTIDIGLQGAEAAASGAKKVDTALAGMGKAALAAGAAFFTAQGVISGVRSLGELAAQATKVEKVARAFESLTDKAKFTGNTLEQLKTATRGAVSEFELMRQTNNALLLGVASTSGQMAEMAEISRRLGAAMGIDTAQALESLVIGIGRQSRLWLDNLGIVVDVEKAYKKYADQLGKNVDELTDYEKKLGFTNETMIKARDLVSGLGDDLVTHGDKIAKANADWENFKNSVGGGAKEFAQESTGFLRALAMVAAAPFSGAARDEIVSTLKRLKEEEIAAANASQDFAKAYTEQDVAASRLLATTKSKAEADAVEAAALDAKTKANEKLMKAEQEATEKRIAANIKESETIAAKIALRIEEEEFTAGMMDRGGEWQDEMISGLEDYSTAAYEAAETLGFLNQMESEVAAMERKRATQRQAITSQTIGQIAGINQALKGSGEVTKRILQIQATVDAYAAANAAFQQAARVFPLPVAIGVGGVALAYGLSNVAVIESQSFARGGVIEGTGGPMQDNVRVNASAGESILNAQATARLGRDGVDALNTGGGGGVTVVIQGNLIGTESFVRDVLVPQIEKSQRRRLA